MTIRAKFTAALLLVAVIFGTAVVAAWQQTGQVGKEMHLLYAGPMRTVDVARTTQRDFMDLRRHYLSASVAPSAQWAVRYHQLRERLSQDLATLFDLAGGLEAQERLRHARAALEEWDVALAQGNFASHRAQVDRLADSFQSDIDILIEMAEHSAVGQIDAVGETLQDGRAIIQIGGAVAVTLGMLIMFALARDIVRPLGQAVHIAESIALGDFQDVPPHSRRDEFGHLLDALFVMQSEIRGKQRELSGRNAELEQIASRDRLTGLYNRRKIEESAAEHLALMKRYGGEFSLLLLDVDHFKAVNDIHGHAAGDAVLSHIAAILNRTVREADIAGRWGGEEFIILLPNTGLEGAAAVGEKVRCAIADHIFPVVGTKTISLGVGQLLERESFSSLVERADQALYRAKREGRNKVVMDGASNSESPDCALS